MGKIFKTGFYVILVLATIPALGIIAVFVNFHFISLAVSHKIYSDADKIDHRKYTLVMGGGNYKPEKWTNHTFIHRMQSTVVLYKKNKTDKILASGVRATSELDEVADMKLVLTEYGIPESDILTDYRGTRTWASVERALKFHKTDTIIIVSQCDQLERALFISGCIGLNAVGLIAEPSPRHHQMWTIREHLSRVKCTLECIAYKFGYSHYAHD